MKADWRRVEGRVGMCGGGVRDGLVEWCSGAGEMGRLVGGLRDRWGCAGEG